MTHRNDRALPGTAASRPSRRAPRLLGLTGSCLLLLLPALAAAQDVTITVGSHPARPQGPLGLAFWILGALTIMGAVLTVSRRNPVAAAISLVGTLICSAGLFLIMQATFMAAIQVLVYAGAIMVLFVFVVMSVEHPEHEELGFLRGSVPKLIGVVAVGWLLFRMSAAVLGPELRPPAEVSADWGAVRGMAKLLFTDYLFPFEAISLLLLTSILGAVVVTRRQTNTEPAEAEDSARRPA